MSVPRHVAIIMDGNGRWARRRLLPRVAGHQRGVESVRAVVSSCLKKEIPYLTLFAFSSENWARPKPEVDYLFNLLLQLLKNEVKELSENGVCLKIIGDRTHFSQQLKTAIESAEALTVDNTKLQLNIAFNYGGRWDLVQAMQKIGQKIACGTLTPETLCESVLNQHLLFSEIPDPDLLIRTSGEYRMSNFLLWQLAYTELYFTSKFWPDFRAEQFDEALQAYADRQRRFGRADPVDTDQIDSFERKIHA